MTVPVSNSPVTASESSGTLSVNISIQKNHQMQFYLLNTSLLFLRMFDICFVRRVVISLVLSHCSKTLKQRTDQCYSSVSQLSFIWQAEENTSSRLEGGLTQKTQRDAPSSILALVFICFFSSPEPAYVNWARQEGFLFYLRSPLQSLGLPLFYFLGLFLFFFFWPPPFCIRFPILTT